jgi:hypothetical protein
VTHVLMIEDDPRIRSLRPPSRLPTVELIDSNLEGP